MPEIKAYFRPTKMPDKIFAFTEKYLIVQRKKLSSFNWRPWYLNF